MQTRAGASHLCSCIADAHAEAAEALGQALAIHEAAAALIKVPEASGDRHATLLRQQHQPLQLRANLVRSN